MPHLRPGDRLAVRGADQVEGPVLRVERDGLLVDLRGRRGRGIEPRPRRCSFDLHAYTAPGPTCVRALPLLPCQLHYVNTTALQLREIPPGKLRSASSIQGSGEGGC